MGRVPDRLEIGLLPVLYFQPAGAGATKTDD
jgi:hypothetical protein